MQEKIFERDFSDNSLYNEVYIPLLWCKKRYIFLVWSWWSWKSSFETQKEIIKSYEEKSRLLWVRKVKDTIKDSIYAELCWVIEKWWLEKDFEITKSPMYIKNKLTWADFIFRWMDDPEKIKSIKWVTRVWIEEATELNKKDFDQIDLRLRWCDNLQITCSLNPIDEDHWINTDFDMHWNTEDVEILHTTYKNNRFVWDQYDKVMERLKVQNPRMYEIYALWKRWRAVEWLIFNFIEIDKVPEEAKKVWYWQDFWFTNDPSAFIWLYEWNWWIILDEEFSRTWMTNQDIIQMYKSIWVWKTDNIVWDSSEPKSIEEIYRAWFNISWAEKWPDSVMFWIQIMQQFTIYITKRSQNLKKEFKNYCWATDKEWKPINKPIDAFNHWIDASRYIITRIYSKAEELIPWVFIF